MTRLPAENRDVIGIEYDTEHPKYKVGPLCAAPGCSRLADHAHHIWRRSFLTGNYGWVQLQDGTTLQNLTGLCYQHHKNITENRDAIRWTGRYYVYDDELVMGAIIDPQPKAWSPHPKVVRTVEGVPIETVTSYAGDEIRREYIQMVDERGEHAHGPGSVEKCPACHRSMPREKSKSEGPRSRKTWSITVPVDARENGAEILDTLVEEVQKVFHHNETKATRYFSLCQALALVLQHQEMLGEG